MGIEHRMAVPERGLAGFPERKAGSAGAQACDQQATGRRVGAYRWIALELAVFQALIG